MADARAPRVVLFNPAPRTGEQAQRRVELPLGLLSVATPLVARGYAVSLVDGFASPEWRRELREALRERPVCFGVTCMTGPQILRALETCAEVRAAYPDVPIVWGGIHPTLLPEQTLRHPLVDIIVAGEGEATFGELVETLRGGGPLGGVRGIWYKHEGEPRFSGARPFIDFAAQPPLEYGLVEMERYRRRLFGEDHVSFTSSRGCTFGCAFCWEGAFNHRRWRPMPPEIVVEHVTRLVRRHGVRGILFTDDNFFADLNRAHRILERIVREELDISIGKLQVRADAVCAMDRDYLDLMARAGAKRLHLGVESGSERILTLINKGETVDEFVEANRKLRGYPMLPLYLFMTGLPTETREDLAQTVSLAARLVQENPRADPSFNIYTPYPGTELYKAAVGLGLKPPSRLEDWAQFNFRNVPAGCTWLTPDMRRLVQGLDFPLMFLGKSRFVTPYKKTKRAVVALSRVYRPVAQYRVRHLDVRFPVESRMVRALGLFGGQD